MKEVNIRRATVADAVTIAGIHLRGWKWAYRGLLPDAFLEGMSLHDREVAWRQQLAPDDARHTWIAEADGHALGTARQACGLRKLRDSALPEGAGEVYAIYQEEQAAGTGIGRALLSRAMSELKSRGFEVAVLWVLESNARARRFYEVAGWEPDGARKQDHRADHVRHEVRYRKDLV